MGLKGLNKLLLTERKMLRMIFVVTPRDRITSSDVAERVGVELMEEWLRRPHNEVVWACIEEWGGYRNVSQLWKW